MRITESRLRQIIRKIIEEDINMRDRLSPEAVPNDPVEKAFKNIHPSKDEIDRLNDIIGRTPPMSRQRDERIAAFNAEFGYGSLQRVCKAFEIKDIHGYKGRLKSI